MARIEKRTLKDGSTRYKAIIRRKDVFKTKTFGTKKAAQRWAKRLEAKGPLMALRRTQRALQIRTTDQYAFLAKQVSRRGSHQ